MFTDLCVPNGNEKEFLEIAERLETKSLLFIYEKNFPLQKEIEELKQSTKINIQFGSKDKKIKGTSIIFANGERKNVENKNIKFLYGFEGLERKDSFHYKRSGVNQVIAKLLKEKEKIFVIDFERILESKNISSQLGRLKQNLSLAKKYGFEIMICSFATKPMNMRSELQLKSILKALNFSKSTNNSTLENSK